jgi:periplasmic protein TonB
MSEQKNTTIFNDWNDVVSDIRNNIVFEGKNKAYGAYFLRKNHNTTLAKALFFTSLFFALGVGMPKIIEFLNSGEEDVEVPLLITNVDLTPPPPLDKTEPPPPPPPPPPAIETIKFTPPVVTDDEVVDDPPPVQTEDLPQISTVTQEGDGSDDVIIPDEIGNGVVQPVEEEIFTIVEQRAEFPGGEQELMNYLSKNIKYPAMEADNGISGRCVLNFIVEKDGSITNVKVVRGVPNGPGLDKEAMRVVSSMPKWKPGKQNGRAIRMYYNLPINFNLK